MAQQGRALEEKDFVVIGVPYHISTWHGREMPIEQDYVKMKVRRWRS